MRWRTMVVLGVLALVASCSSTQSGQSLVPATSAPPSSVTTSSESTTTTVAPSTEAPTTTIVAVTLPAVTPGWTQLDRDTVDGFIAFPCCASNWYGEPSPPLPQPGEALPSNGSYAVSMTWGPDPAAPLQLELRRFEQCNVLPANSCEDVGGTWDPTELGVDGSATLPLTVPLDDHVRIVLTGFAGFADSSATVAMAEANGADLAELAVAVEAAHASVLMPKLASGMTPDQVVAAVSAAPEGGFVAGLDGSEYSLSFVHGAAPPLLFQAAFGFEDPSASRGTDVLGIPSVQMIEGVLTVYVYAGFYS